VKFDKIILDFDDTLFDDNRFMGDIFLVFQRYGINKKDFDDTYQRIKELRGGLWHPLNQAGLLFKILPMDFASNIERVFSNSRRYIFKDALAFLRSVKVSKSILSFGDEEAQLKKINNSDIVQYLSSVNITSDKSKKSFFEELGSGSGQIAFIDDKPLIVDTIKANFPDVFCVLMLRNQDNKLGLTKSADAIIKTFDDFPLLYEDCTC